MDELEKTPLVADEIETETFGARAANAFVSAEVARFREQARLRQVRSRELKRRESERRREREERINKRNLLRTVRGGECICGAAAAEHGRKANGKPGGCERTECPEYFERGT